MQIHLYVEKEAKKRFPDAGGDPNNAEWVPCMSSLQFGKYRSKNFLWLLQNEIGCSTTMVMSDHVKMREQMQWTNDHQWGKKHFKMFIVKIHMHV